MKILEIETTPLATIPSVSVAPGGAGIEDREIPVLRGYVDSLPDDLGALILTSDLQGFETAFAPVWERVQLGHLVAQTLEEMAILEQIPPADRTGVLLAGDLYAIPEMNKRGGTGDVQDVWFDFARRFRWVCGVAGNHDYFRGRLAFDNFNRNYDNTSALHGDLVERDGLKVAGISGIRGKKSKPWRYGDTEFFNYSKLLLKQKPDFLVLHEGPDHLERRFQGSPFVRETLGKNMGKDPETVVVCGHSHWKSPLAEIQGSFQAINVDSRIVVLMKAGGG